MASALADLGQLAFRIPFGLAENAEWLDLLDCITLNEPDLDLEDDRTRWRLEPSGQFSTKFLYRRSHPVQAPRLSPPFGRSVSP